MDWLKKIPVGQYVVGKTGWIRLLDPRIKFSWVLMFLLTPVLSQPIWRVSLVLGLLIITFGSCLPMRIWWRSLLILFLFSIFVGLFSMMLPASESVPLLSARPPDELPEAILVSPNWHVFSIGPFEMGGISLGPFVLDRRSAELGIKTSTLTFTVIQSVNLMLLTTTPEHLVWALRWFFTPLRVVGFPLDRLCFQLLLSLRFLPLVQEELQNIFRSVGTRAIDFKSLGFKSSLSLILSISERFLFNILLRAEQGADALLTKSGYWMMTPEEFRPDVLINPLNFFLNFGSCVLLFFVLILRSHYGKF